MNRIEKLKTFLQENPDDSFVQHALALEYLKLNEETQARKLFEELLNRDPSHVGSYYHLAKLLERLGEKDNAQEWYRRGMEEAKTKGDRHAYNELQMAYEDLMDL